MSLLSLPNELLLQIARNLSDVTHLSAFLRANQRLAMLLAPLLRKFAVQDKSGKNALLWAAHRGHAGLVKLLLEEGFDIDTHAPLSLETDNTALHYAVMAEREEIVKLLLENGANVNSNGFGGNTALYLAAKHTRCGKIVRMLLDAGADYEHLDATGKTPLHIAAMSRAETPTRALLEKGADANRADRAGMRPLHLAIAGESQVSYAVVCMLIEYGADVSARDLAGQSALYLAARKGNDDVVAFILANGGDTNESRSGLHNTGQNALQVAAFFGHEEIVRRLLEKRRSGDLAYRDYDGYTALDHAVISACRSITDRRDRRPTVSLLIETEGLGIYTLKTLNNALLWASEKGHEDILIRLLESGAEISSQHHSIPWVRADGRVGDTVLHVAAEYGHPEIVRILIAKGASVKARNRLGNTPLDLALQRAKAKDPLAGDEVVKILISKAQPPPRSSPRNHRDLPLRWRAEPDGYV